jgi:5-methylthioribose kinase
MLISFQTRKEELTIYLQSQGFIDDEDEVIRLEKPGEGNMNFVARVITQNGSLIIKQANPYVQKYPHIKAPQERLLVESQFYQTIQAVSDLALFMPSLLGIDTIHHIMALQDVGDSRDFTYLYKKNKSLTSTELRQLVDFLNRLHQIPVDKISDYPTNLALRRLNHEHLFRYPFMIDNGFDLNTIQAGLQEISSPYKTDSRLKLCIDNLGEQYLSQGTTLLHGDYYPGSWLKTKHNLKVIDPEFSFTGRREFDLGVMIAHLKMCETPEDQINSVILGYQSDRNFSWDLCHQFTGIEIMRRIIGLAQLPLDLSLNEKEHLLKEAYNFILKP